ncbi:MAG TPA: hypothetical protein VFA11_18650 [Acidimicrobiales bacterium]|nr:hypothetical protein [Acidimicrobiales bacterium]
MEIRAGARLHSAECSTEVVVLKEPATPGTLSCGGTPMAAGSNPSGSAPPPPGGDAGCVLGKRYIDEESGLEVLCAKAGAGPLEFEGRPLTVKGAKPLPSSD